MNRAAPLLYVRLRPSPDSSPSPAAHATSTRVSNNNDDDDGWRRTCSFSVTLSHSAISCGMISACFLRFSSSCRRSGRDTLAECYGTDAEQTTRLSWKK